MRVLITNVPKAGTNLVLRVFALMPGYKNSKRFLRNNVKEEEGGLIGIGINSPQKLTRKTTERVLTKACKHQQFISGHVPYHPALDKILKKLDYKSVLMVRDPRDVIVSLVYYVMKNPQHYLHKYFKNLPDFDARLMKAITGLKTPDVFMLPLKKQIDSLEGWLDSNDCYVTRFEDLVGPAGGGSKEAQVREVINISRHVNLDLDDATIQKVADGLFSKKTHTFRKGTIGDWKNHFKAPHTKLFNKLVGSDYLERLGYL